MESWAKKEAEKRMADMGETVSLSILCVVRNGADAWFGAADLCQVISASLGRDGRVETRAVTRGIPSSGAGVGDFI